VETIHIHVTGFHQFYPHDKPLVNPVMLDITPIATVYSGEGPSIVVVADSVFAHPRYNSYLVFQRYTIGYV